MRTVRNYIILLLTIVAVLVSCSNEKNTWYSRHYQALTSNFNVYFNGKEAFIAGVDKIRDGYKNDYSHVLPVYEFSDKQASGAGSSDMETALKKAHKMIQLHSITVKPERKDDMTEKDRRFYAQEEFNPLVDDAYLLIGKANVVRHENEEAIDVFDFISRKFIGNETSYEGKIWKSIAYCQMEQYNNAISALESYDLDGIAPADLYGEYMAAYANVYICQQKYKSALHYMEEAVAKVSGRHLKYRYKYILAQLYRIDGQNDKAAPLFLELSKILSDYDMAFAAKLDLATVATTPEELQKAEKLLAKMSKDEKNKEQLDQIYYAIGKMDEGRGEKDKALAAYQRSITASVSNDNQKGLSFLAKADIYIVRPTYIEASESLDSAVFYLDDANIRKKEATKQAARLAPLAKELRVVRDNDSLLRIANMSTAERDAFIQKMLDEAERIEREKKEALEAEAEDGMTQSQFNQVARNNTGSQSGSSWYFYNTNTVNAGKSAFASKWGRRKNEDNWRRSDKSSNTMMTINEEDVFPVDSVAGDNSKKEDEEKPKEKTPEKMSRETLLANIPLTQEQQEVTNKAIDKALFNSGTLLYDDLKDYDSAIRQLKSLNSRYPKSENRYNSLVLLYFAQNKSEMNNDALQTAETIKREFPESSFAKYLSSGDYFTDKALERAEKEAKYEYVYNSYLSSNFSEAINAASSALSQLTDSVYAPKLLLVRSLSYAKQAQTIAFRSDLVEITERYSGGAEDSVAHKLLALLDEGKEPVKSVPYDSPLADEGKFNETLQTAAQEYTYRPDTAHTVICVIATGMKNDAQFAVADYNFTNYLLEDLDIRVGQMTDRRQLVVVSGFANKVEAMNYYYAVRDKDFWADVTETTVPEIYVVSDNNYRLVLISSIDDEYKQFFDDYYLKRPITE